MEWISTEPNDNGIIARGVVNGIEVCRVYHNQPWHPHSVTLMVDLPGAQKKSVLDNLDDAKQQAERRVGAWIARIAEGRKQL